jgi:diguanylate cyclase (GGDEF)-like protein
MVLLAVGFILIAAMAGILAYATAHAVRSHSPTEGPGEGARGRRDPVDGAIDQSTTPASSAPPSGFLFSRASTRQVARWVAFLFLASAFVVVALTGAWPDTEPAIYTLLAAGMLFVVLFMDMLPPSALGRWRRPIEGVGAVVYLGLLIGLTGGVGSPFIVGFFLIVAGTALSTEGSAPILVALVAAATIAVVGFAASFDAATEAQGLAWIGFNAVALILLADIATAAARSQRQARDQALQASRFDALTGLYNRSFFFTTMEQEIRRSDRMGRGFTMLMLDLDDLKPVNDTFGHQWGDRLIKAIAGVIRHTIRFTDSAARYGGDEFVVLLPETDASGGYVVGEKLRRDIAVLTLHAADRNVRSSVSVGLVTYPDDGTSIEQLVAAADVAMYEAKRRGKNRIVGYQTRTERVATALDVEGGELVQLGPVADVRTGGDPAPWGPAPDADVRVSYGGQPTDERRLESSAKRRYDTPSESEPRRSQVRPASPEPERPASQPPSVPDGSRAPADGSRAPADESRAPAGEPRRSSYSPDPDRPTDPGPERPAEPGPGAADQPWLTRTDAHRPDSPRPLDVPPQRPAADARSGRREMSRTEEIQLADDPPLGQKRPWVVLPIEPYDPPERSSGQKDRPEDQT